jgi:hypothetical protein
MVLLMDENILCASQKQAARNFVCDQPMLSVLVGGITAFDHT